jgi:glycine/D-amino acid oxidase-like deaminating enzyme
VKLYPYWWDSLPGARPASGPFDPVHDADQSSLPARADVVVAGAGYTGLSAARRLARSGASVVVLERERVGWGASSRNGGQVLTGLKAEPAALVARFGESRARALFHASIAAIAALEQVIAEEQMSCGYERTGHLVAASKPAHFEAFKHEQALLARVFDHRVELLPESDQTREIGSRAYHGGMIDERSAGIDPARFVSQLADAARRSGAVIVEGTPVESVSRAAEWTVTTNRGSIRASELLVATNGYATSATPWLQRRFVPIGSYSIATAPLDDRLRESLIPKRRMVFDSKHFLHYFRFTPDHRLLFGGRAVFARPTADTTRRSADILRRDMAEVFPALSATPVEYAWSGNVAYTRDQVPHAGRISGAFYAGGYCGHGVAMATALGEIIARRMAGEAIEHPLLDDRFPAIPFYRGDPWFLPLAGAYFRLLDLLT